ncbi:DUF4136 domain-containing protein [Novosphingobium mangrovi (ex Hu et al. 2023)]|uniref:DUF4136 domain-containing protein n=1 Tax=Novosphingobium mangrovi (ex Hu et al. 2023) TaxID=2930094 RepID=A0ABT0AHB9_9SPHN|nr:DUF4136 domain-containing protein [Novosphingobium mangrovi (ex Hu et al. 2023)]MCJ1962584.1 DUF4136 domain-containing protein [Novosphingobium mangrovi (ex Hu et al. 2023)]
MAYPDLSANRLSIARPLRRAAGRVLTVSLASALLISPALAQPGWGSRYGGWGGYGGYGGWRGPGWSGPIAPMAPRSSHREKDPRDGRVQVSRFVRADTLAEALGHGPIKVVTTAQDNGPEGDWVDPSERARFEAAVVNSLVNAGYDTLNTTGPDTQVAALTIRQRVLVPAEMDHKPVSGAAAVSVGTLGTAYGLSVNVDMSKPRTALVSTRLELTIRDRAEGKVLWEGKAEMATYEGDEDWSEAAIATRLADALLDRFPDGEPVTVPVTEIGIPEAPEVLPDPQNGALPAN